MGKTITSTYLGRVQETMFQTSGFFNLCCIVCIVVYTSTCVCGCDRGLAGCDTGYRPTIWAPLSHACHQSVIQRPAIQAPPPQAHHHHRKPFGQIGLSLWASQRQRGLQRENTDCFKTYFNLMKDCKNKDDCQQDQVLSMESKYTVRRNKC